MELFPASLIVIVVWLLLSLRVAGSSFAMAVAMLPFGMFAVFQLPSLGGLSITATVLFAAFAAALSVARRIMQPATGEAFAVSPASLAMGAFALYATFSAVVLVRYFQGAFLVFPLARGATGVRVDPGFPSVMAPIAPSSGNISQAFYILIAFAFFVAYYGWIRRAGAVAAERHFVVAATLNIILALINIAGLDIVLNWVQTASYSLHDQQTMAGVRRIIGGFPEPAPFGAISAAFFGYFLSSWSYSGRTRDLVLAAANGGCAIVSYSSTGYAAIGVVLVFLFVRSAARFQAKRAKQGLILTMVVLFACLAMAAAIVAATPLLQVAEDLLNRLFLSKLTTLSGQERSAWAQSGMDAFMHTWGLGAGAGSLRSNGLLPVMLGSVGALGTLLFAVFLWLCIGRSARGIRDDEAQRIYSSAQVAAIAQLSALMLSATVPDPSLLLIVCCAMAAGARDTQTAEQPESAGTAPLTPQAVLQIADRWPGRRPQSPRR